VAWHETVGLGIGGEGGFVVLALSRALGRPQGPLVTAEPLDSTLAGAFSAVALEVIRRAHGTLPLRVRAHPLASEHDADGVRADSTILIDGRAFAATASVRWRSKASLALAPRCVELADIGGVS